MNLFNKKKLNIDERVKAYEETFVRYVNSVSDNITLNTIFTEITVLRIKLDKNDHFFTNIKDATERRKHCNRNELIVIQFKDIMETSFNKYNKDDYELIDSTMRRILPQGDQTNWWSDFWNFICECFNNATGKR